MSDVAAPSSAQRRIRIGDLLVQNQVITEDQLMSALAEQKTSGKKLGNTLIDLGFIDEMRLLQFLSQQLQIPLIDLTATPLDPAVAQQLPETIARRYRVVVIESRERDALVGMADPTDLFAFDELSRVLKKRIRQAVVREADVLFVLDKLYQVQQEDLSLLVGELDQELSQGDIDLGQLVEESGADEAPVFRLLTKLFEDAMRAKASDIHIEPEEKVLRIRLRIDGVLSEQVLNEARIAAALVQRLKLLADLDISEKRLPQDGRFQIKVKDHQVDVRLSTMPVAAGEVVVMRLLDQSAGILDLQQLGMPQQICDRVQAIIRRPHGMLLVTGPTGSGKTTTLYSALSELNTPEHKIITVEDPVEYRLPRINQVQVHEQIDLSFARVLRTALRQDPDVIMVGEMRDLETAQIGLRASITGHFVLSTLHTNSAIATISRLLDMGAPGFLMASALQGVLAQRLVRKNCAHCTTSVQPDEHELAWLKENKPDLPDDVSFSKGAGCPRCNNTGYKGRIGVYELLEVQGSLINSLRNEDINQFSKEAKESGFVSLVESALEQALEGKTSLAEVMRISD